MERILRDGATRAYSFRHIIRGATIELCGGKHMIRFATLSNLPAAERSVERRGEVEHPAHISHIVDPPATERLVER